ncbi:fimbrial chaperone [Salmonella enterica subsp. enterica]|nr:fimbrial chaperone [Salmonella enterica subsp. enterica]EDW9588879.1 fimbrial chaperone [Salmonella enterica subsp. enterica]EED9671620.1 fimbrial chaperone [Salmonella enterica subsp. enterica]EIO7468736.1 fimbrial chaperone [Salmonella enterica subsp. enterica]EIY5764482.1 fimbrial chaperone [Salmonella enterica subsp. enterica]
MSDILLIKSVKSLLLATAFLAAFQASADIVISGTRIIYTQSSKDVVVNLDNHGKKPLLVQTWLDDGRDGVNPEELKLPFIITPPVSRIDPKKGQSLRITYTGTPLPQDRESLFWFNVLEIPPKSKNADKENQNQLQLAFRTRIKFFFRPDGLKGTPGDAAEQLTWSQKKEGNATKLVAHNNSPYNVSVSMVKIKIGQKTYEVAHQSVKPFSDATMQVKGLASTVNGKVLFETINDYGGTDLHEAELE